MFAGVGKVKNLAQRYYFTKITSNALLEINECGQVIPKIYNVENNMLLTNEGIAKISLDDDCILNVWGLGEYEKMNLQLHNSETE